MACVNIVHASKMKEHRKRKEHFSRNYSECLVKAAKESDLEQIEFWGIFSN